ncbi:MAG: hypothetical protein IIB02_05905 [Thaumarchaeota archaeon]|nr:hypothetical protein [Nitrososphaerota archaeon]
MVEGKFATSVSCIDGRIQTSLAKWIKENYSVDYVDTITEPGIDKTITENSVFESIKIKVSISINAHKSELVVLSGHYDCAANPVSNEKHIEFIKKGIQVISSWNLGVKVIGVWVDDSWNVNTI